MNQTTPVECSDSTTTFLARVHGRLASAAQCLVCCGNLLIVCAHIMLAYDVLHFWDCLQLTKTFHLLLLKLRGLVQLLRSNRVMNSTWDVDTVEISLLLRLTITKVFPVIIDLRGFSTSEVTVCPRIVVVIQLPRRQVRFSISKVYRGGQSRALDIQLVGRLRSYHTVTRICLDPIDWKPQVVAFHGGNFPRRVETFLGHSLPLGHLVLIHGEPRSWWSTSCETGSFLLEFEAKGFLQTLVRLGVLELWCVQFGAV